MILRKTFSIIFCSLLAPIILSIRWLPNILEAIISKKYTYYNFHITSLKELLVAIYGQTYFGMTIISLVFIFIPFQLIKNFTNKEGSGYSFLEKSGILAGIFALGIIIFGLLSNIWWVPWYKNFIYLICAIVFGLIFNTIIYFIVDRYEDRLLN